MNAQCLNAKFVIWGLQMTQNINIFAQFCHILTYFNIGNQFNNNLRNLDKLMIQMTQTCMMISFCVICNIFLTLFTVWVGGSSKNENGNPIGASEQGNRSQRYFYDKSALKLLKLAISTPCIPVKLFVLKVSFSLFDHWILWELLTI